MRSFVLMLFVGQLCEAAPSSVTDNAFDSLASDLLDSYDSRIQPLERGDKSVDVNLTYEMDMIHSYDDLTGELTFLGRIEAQWYDHRLTWNTADYGTIDRLVLPKTDVWHPSFEMPTSVHTNRLPGLRGSTVGLSYTGDMMMVSTDLLTVICPADVRNYPNDVQTCKASILPRGYKPIAEVNFVLSHGLSTTVTVENSEWAVNNLTYSINPQNGAFFIDMTIERRNAFPKLTMSIPMYLLSAINPIVFLLPAESGERVSFSVTTTLAFTVYISILSDQIPAGSDPVASLVIEVFAMLLYSVLILLATIISLRFHHNADRIPVPRWARYLTSAIGCRCCCRCKSAGLVPDKNKVVAFGETPAGNHDVNINDEHLKSRCGDNVTWYDVSRTFDTAMLIVCYALFVTEMVIFHAGI